MNMSSVITTWATKKPFGYRQRYFIEAGSRQLGCIMLSGAARSVGSRDRWIGWNERQRMKNLPWVLNNSRFLIFPWVRIQNLASHVLAQLVRRACDDWQQHWGYRPVLLETFVDPLRFHGGCYRAAGSLRSVQLSYSRCSGKNPDFDF